MSLEMHVKQSYIEKHKQRERVRMKLDKLLEQNAVQLAKVARLSAIKASLETELAAVLEDTAQTRQQRRELELADEKERLRRQREAERELQIRLREEEWKNMIEEEKARSQVAAEARAKANKRVEAHSATQRKMVQSYRYERRQSKNESPSTAGVSNNDITLGDDDDGVSRNDSEDQLSEPVQLFKMNFYLPPELADFEEDGLCNNNEQQQVFMKNACETEILQNNTQERWPTLVDNADEEFRWRVPRFPDPDKFTELLLGMLSDDEDE
ncbi:unnamed protein product [Phytophthora fragariaefolia]|uniref:Unnamed protein product n=1 Tax=Phytophthora fragariaefolia TaxID=1490495 RepID=A0A9W6XC03_9STRA|nr:unnamed protein product [Phytophthora fragariaefolia]